MTKCPILTCLVENWDIDREHDTCHEFKTYFILCQLNLTRIMKKAKVIVSCYVAFPIDKKCSIDNYINIDDNFLFFMKYDLNLKT